MALPLKKIILTILLFSIALTAFSQIDIRVMHQGAYVPLDTVHVSIDVNDNSGTGIGEKDVFFRIYNTSPTDAEAFYLEAEWICSNSSAFYQYCQQYPPDYASGTCDPFHREGIRVYDNYNYSIFPDTCNYNYLMCYFKIYDYSVEKEHEKVCRFTVKRRNTHELLDSMYLIISRGDLPCYERQPVDTGSTGINTLIDEVVEIYPNPARNFFTITAKQDQLVGYTLYTPDGRMLSDKNIEHQKRININVADLSNGIYYLKLTDSRRKSFYKKIVVDH